MAVPTLATVQINDPHTLNSFSVGGQVSIPTMGPTSYWDSYPAPLTSGPLLFDFLTDDPTKTSGIQYGKLDFTVETNGPVWMLTTTRFGEGGNDSGGWVPELSSESQLQASGWSIIAQGIQTESGYSAFGSSDNYLDNFTYTLFQRQSVAGETFSIRTEKYYAPVILQNVAPVPEPSTLALLACAGFALVPLARRKWRGRVTSRK